jgi:hypothetical protein
VADEFAKPAPMTRASRRCAPGWAVNELSAATQRRKETDKRVAGRASVKELLAQGARHETKSEWAAAEATYTAAVIKSDGHSAAAHYAPSHGCSPATASTVPRPFRRRAFDAIAHLAQAVELDKAYGAKAATDAAFFSLRPDEEFAFLVGARSAGARRSRRSRTAQPGKTTERARV